MKREYVKTSDKQLAPRDCVCASLRRATRSITQLFDNTMRPCGLRATQFNILAEIQAAGEATVTALTKKLLIDQTTLTRSLALLERAGLLKTVPKPDGRLKSVRLTKKGEQAVTKAQPLWAAAQKQVIARLGARAWESLSSELERLSHGA
jgi:DNA-binding MarR family transcriptional regulator